MPSVLFHVAVAVQGGNVEFLRLFFGTTDGTAVNYTNAFIGNLIISIVCLTWTAGVGRAKRDAAAWIGWLVFWFGTSLFYLLKVIRNEWTPWCVPEFGLYLATGGLLVGHLSSARNGSLWTPWAHWLLPLAAVGLVVLADVATYHYTSLENKFAARTGWHQTLAFVALSIWAWRIRERDVSNSVLLLAYALVQLPMQPVLEVLRIPTGMSYDAFVLASYGIFAALKLGILGAVYSAVAATKEG